MKSNDKYLVYENWRAERKAVVHKSTCGHAREGLDRLQDYTAPNDRWYGYFDKLTEAISFAALMPNRQLKICGVCLQEEKARI
ncbi:hypothetical protein [Flavobacterium sp.]|uniref:hypothetical protein n=1 Tax=Flavobacterium sp. TaxID=239 RepID=UPI00374DCC4D